MHQFLFPLSRYKPVTFLLILMSVALIVGQILLADVNPVYLWTNWIVAGLFALGLWYVIGQFHLGGVSEGKALAIAWPLMSISHNYSYLYFQPSYPFHHGLISLIALMLIIAFMLSIWQEERSPVRCLGIGLLIGVSATLFPHTILWLLLIPLAAFHTRSTSERNIFSVLTGALLGLWIAYCYLLLIYDAPTADGMMFQFLQIIDFSGYFDYFLSFSLWQWLYLLLFIMLLIIYSISAMILGTGHSVRSSASIMLLSTLSLAAIVFLVIDPGHMALYICQLALFLSIQLTIHQANLRSSAHEWWTIMIIITCIGFSVLPLIF